MKKLKKLFMRIKELLLSGYAMFQKNKITIYSGYTTLFIVTALIPFIILIIAIVNLIPGYSAEDVADILMKILPDLQSVKDLVLSLVTELKDKTGGLLASVAAVSTLWAASKGVMAIQKGLNQLDSRDDEDETGDYGTGVDETGEIVSKGIDYVTKTAKRLVFTLILIILIPAMMVFEMLGDSTEGAIATLLTILCALIVVMEIYARLPSIRRTLKSQFPGAVCTVLGWWAFTALFSFFISKSYKYSSLYGSLAAIFLLLMWLRYMIMILFGGGVLNRVLEEEQNRIRE